MIREFAGALAMKYVDEFRDGELARGMARSLAALAPPDRDYRFMEFCGGHTHAISRYGLEDLLPANIRMIHGPGCPVCVLPIGRIDAAIALAQNPKVTLCTYADLMRVPASRGASLMKAKAARRRYSHGLFHARRAAHRRRRSPTAKSCSSPSDSRRRRRRPRSPFVSPQQKRLRNFSIFCNHVLTPAAMRAILAAEEGVALDGFVGPSHVSAVIGMAPYGFVATEFAKPIVIAGFEPLDVMQAIVMLVRQVNEGRREVENQYGRAVTAAGNVKAQTETADIFELRESFEWRGLGSVPNSALRLRAAYADYDAEQRFDDRDAGRERQSGLRMRRNPARREAAA